MYLFQKISFEIFGKHRSEMKIRIFIVFQFRAKTP